MRQLILFTLLNFLLFSCSSENNKAKNEEQKVSHEKNKEQKKAQAKKERLENLESFASQFGAFVGFDTLRFSLTYEYENFFEKNNKIVLENFIIDDVEKKDSVYIISINKGYYPKLFFELVGSLNQVQELLADTSSKRSYQHYGSNDKAIVVAITSVKKVKFQIETDVRSSGSEEPIVNMDLGPSDNFILKGQVISVSKKQIQ